MCTRVTLCLSALLALAGSSPAQEPKETALKPTLVLSGTHSAIRKERTAVVTGAAEWKELWKEHRGKEYDPPFTERLQELNVDFDTHYVVALFTGPGGWCWITPRMRGGDVVIGFGGEVFSTEGRPPELTAGEKAKQEAEAPYTFVVLPKPVKAVVIEQDIRRSKLDPPLWKEAYRYPAPKDKK
jgi:hypothetical protein